ncbi:SDR family NAD(P)-dependent oxidoreductase [Mycolicibacterium septicum]|uniref:SDR family NAD(P)-dependent oxidoreductase n=1 Tax=Mycolicibacterium septicum TaxID=98668 RepID=UPI0023E0E021|nr:SDR family NAD(P)-dependent oxidoreductase [Mycolicibacterium septicum]MDF3337195.1 SDR family NAD(P)-dependent oxidoreductase [Mycolicibacterium septicum]
MNPERKTIVITGASDGLGAAAARQLSRRGDNVVVVGRSPGKTAAVAGALGADHLVADFAELAQVRDLATQLLDRYPRIDVLANNAGGLLDRTRQETVDGFEKTFQVNHLAPFLLTTLLLDRLIAARASVINTSSVGNRLFGHIDITDLNHERGFKAQKAYGDAKLANILFTKELHRRHHSDGISTAAFHPGSVASNFGAEANNPALELLYRTPLKKLILVSPDKGADQLVWLATSTPGTDWTSGQYYARRKPGRPNKQANDPVLAQQLWDRSLEMVGA